MNLLKALEESGYISVTAGQVLAHFSQKWNLPTYDALLITHAFAEHSLADVIAEIFKVDRLYSFETSDLDQNSLKKLSFSESKKLQCVVANTDEKGVFQVYMLNPLDAELMNFLREFIGEFRPVILDKRLMMRVLEEAFPVAVQIPSLFNVAKD